MECFEWGCLFKLYNSCKPLDGENRRQEKLSLPLSGHCHGIEIRFYQPNTEIQKWIEVKPHKIDFCRKCKISILWLIVSKDWKRIRIIYLETNLYTAWLLSSSKECSFLPSLFCSFSLVSYFSSLFWTLSSALTCAQNCACALE